MIFTVTLNPSLDCVMALPALVPNGVARAQAQALIPGGKGINVARMLDALGVPAKAAGFLAGGVGRLIAEKLGSLGCPCDFVFLEEGESRINVKLSAGDGFEVNGPGPRPEKGAVGRLIETLSPLSPGDFLVLSGSIPAPLPADTYARILSRLAPSGARFVVDAAGEALLRALPFRPFLIKPNEDELFDLFGARARTLEGTLACARRLQQLGAENVLLSRGEKGALLLTGGGKILTRRAPQGKVVSTVGAGDAMVAGFLAGYCRRGSFAEALEWGLCAGSATAFCEGIADGDAVRALLG